MSTIINGVVYTAWYSFYFVLLLTGWLADAILPHVRKRVTNEISARVIAVAAALAALLTFSTTIPFLWEGMSSSSCPNFLVPLFSFLGTALQYFSGVSNIITATFELIRFVVNYVLASSQILANVFTSVASHPYIAICIIVFCILAL
jgi:hypothetical protein